MHVASERWAAASATAERARDTDQATHVERVRDTGRTRTL